MTIEIRTIQLRHARGTTNEVEAIMCGEHLCVHRSLDFGEPWTVTHALTGHRVCFASDVIGAIRAAQAVAPLADWSFRSPDGARSIPNEARAQMHAIFKAAGDPRYADAEVSAP